MKKLGKGYIVVATLRDKNTKYFERIMCLTLTQSSHGAKFIWSNSAATVFHLNEIPENDKNYKPWKQLSMFERQKLTFYPCQQLKPLDMKSSVIHLSPSIKSPNFWAYSKSPNELAYRIAKNMMMMFKHSLGRLYECRVYRVGADNCPVILELGKERLYERRMYEFYSNDDMSSIHHILKTYDIAWRKNIFC